MDEFMSKIDRICSSLMPGDMKSNMDETLLEKLLELFQKICQYDLEIKGKKCDPLILLKNTKLIPLFKTCLECMITSPKTFSQPILTFGLKALGIFLSLETIFSIIQEESILLPLLETACEKGFDCHIPFVHVSLLFCLKKISLHKLGLSWILSIGGMLLIFQSFFVSSFNVMRDYWELLSSILVFVSNELEAAPSDMYVLRSFLDDFVSNCIFPALKMHTNPLVQDYTVFMLKRTMTQNVNLRLLFCAKYKLMEELWKYFQCIPVGSYVSENMISLFVECYISTKDVITVDQVIEFLISKALVKPAINFCVQMLIREYANKSLNSLEPVAIILAPLYSSIEICIDNSLDAELLNLELLNNVMESSEKWIDYVTIAIVSSMDIVPFMSHEVISHFVLIVCEFLNACFKKKTVVCPSLHRSTKLEYSVLDLAVKIIECETFKTLNADFHLKLLKGLMVMESSVIGTMISSTFLKVIQKLINSVGLDTLCPKDMEMLIREKLFLFNWFLVDDSLEVIHCIIKKCEENHTEWIELICSNFIYECLWNFVKERSFRSCAKATSIHILCSIRFSPFLWKRYALKYEIKHDDFMQALVKHVEVTNATIVQRAAMDTLCRWINSFKTYDTDCAFIAFKLLENVISKSCVWDCRMSAVKAWESIAQTVLLNAEPSENSVVTVRTTVQLLDQYGFCSSLLLALNDENTSVRNLALNIFLEIQQKFSGMGINENSVSFEPTNQPEIIGNSHLSEGQMDVQESFPSKENSDSAICETLQCSFADLIATRSVVNEIKECVGYKKVLSNSDTSKKTTCFQFWKTLWLHDLQSKLAFYDQSSDADSNNPVDFLDDILDAIYRSVIDSHPEHL